MLFSAILAVLTFSSLNPPAPPQTEASGLDQIAAELRLRTAERRTAAAEAWKTEGKALLKDYEGALQSILTSFAPEIQDPILLSLRESLGAKHPNTARINAHLKLLQQVVNVSGADRLARSLGKLPSGMEIGLYETLALRGGATSLRVLESRLNGDDPGQRVNALMVLLEHGPIELCQSWVARSSPRNLDSNSRILALQILSKRDLPGNFLLSAEWLALESPHEQNELFKMLLAHPQADVEKMVLDLVLDSNRLPELRKNGLAILEHGVRELKWRNTKRKLSTILRDKDGDPLAVETAWALHRMDEKAGKKFLLAGPQAEVRRNKANWRSHLTLGELQVNLGEFRDAFKSYKDAIAIAEARRGRLRELDWLYAARAAAGARKVKDAGDWLARTRMSASELAPYRDLPEFQPLLDKQPFQRLFGL